MFKFVVVYGLLLAVAPFVRGLSSADIVSVFGPSPQGLTGSSLQLPKFVLTVMTNQTHGLFSINATKTPVADAGWMALGLGTAMINADILVTWPNLPAPPGTPAWTLSHRQASGHTLPLDTSPTTSSSAFFTLVPSLSSSDPASPYTVVSWIRLLSVPSTYPSTSTFIDVGKSMTDFIYASSSIRPGSSAEDSPISKHNEAHANVLMDLSTAATPEEIPSTSGQASGTVPPSWSSESWPTSVVGGRQRVPLTRRDMVLVAHATIASVALLFFSPLAILTARYFRHLPWFRIHASIQIGAYALVVIAFSLAVTSVKESHFSNSHARLGLIIFLCLSIQIIIGLIAHRTPPTRLPVLNADGRPETPTVFAALKGKPKVRLGHIAFGLGITILGWAQIRLGLEEWVEYSDSGNSVPAAVVIIFWILIGVESAEVFLGRFIKEEMVHQARALTPVTSRGTSLRSFNPMRSLSLINPMRRRDTEQGTTYDGSSEVARPKRPTVKERDSDDATVFGEGAKTGSTASSSKVTLADATGGKGDGDKLVE